MKIDSFFNPQQVTQKRRQIRDLSTSTIKLRAIYPPKPLISNNLIHMQNTINYCHNHNIPERLIYIYYTEKKKGKHIQFLTIVFFSISKILLFLC